MRYLVITLLATLMSGCIDTTNVRTRVAGAYDAALENAWMTTCNDVSVGSVMRRYGVSTERAEAWRQFCFGDEDSRFILTEPAGE